ncbi:MAG: hypothetical protein MZV70_51185 [Desulfobacterales bacterium]|nr:hypothetical protein [Desulfobacterales bacterium]
MMVHVGKNMIRMKRVMLLILMGLTVSCGSLRKPSATIEEDELIITRKYVGDFIEHRQTGPENYDGPNMIWIKTSMEDVYGKISAYGRKCEFAEGDRLIPEKDLLQSRNSIRLLGLHGRK